MPGACGEQVRLLDDHRKHELREATSAASLHRHVDQTTQRWQDTAQEDIVVADPCAHEARVMAEDARTSGTPTSAEKQ
jgi:hypothetical protein